MFCNSENLRYSVSPFLDDEFVNFANNQGTFGTPDSLLPMSSHEGKKYNKKKYKTHPNYCNKSVKPEIYHTSPTMLLH